MVVFNCRLFDSLCYLKVVCYIYFLFPGDPLAKSTFFCLLSIFSVIPCDAGRHAQWRHRLHWLLLGNWLFAPHLNCLCFLKKVDHFFSASLSFVQAASPASTELETVMMDWLGKMLKLPDCFLFSGVNSEGGGVIQVTAVLQFLKTWIYFILVSEIQPICPSLWGEKMNKLYNSYYISLSSLKIKL